MGCDIHFYVEKKNSDGNWVSIDEWTDEPDYEGGTYKHVDWKKSFYSGRNYDLFAILADVRNGRGFAGVKMGDGFIPIAAPKGIPDDCSDEYRGVCERWDGDGHSHSYFTVAEFLAYDWTQKTFNQGMVSLNEWMGWQEKAKSNPELAYEGSYSGDIWGQDILKVPQSEVLPIFLSAGVNTNAELRKKHPAKEIYVAARWPITYKEAASEFHDEVLPRLQELAEGDPESVRAVFFFDN